MRNSDRRDKRRGARQRHKRLLYCVNVNRTSLDHLLLGRNADVDKSVEWSEYSAGSGRIGRSVSLNFGFGTRKQVTGSVYQARAGCSMPLGDNSGLPTIHAESSVLLTRRGLQSTLTHSGLNHMKPIR